MITFEELKPEITPEFIKQCVELADGFDVVKNHNDSQLYIHFNSLNTGMQLLEIIDDEFYFPLLLHRTVEGWNDKIDKDVISINSSFVLHDNVYYYENYQPCHLTACEMAILDCLIEVLK